MVRSKKQKQKKTYCPSTVHKQKMPKNHNDTRQKKVTLQNASLRSNKEADAAEHRVCMRSHALFFRVFSSSRVFIYVRYGSN